MTKSLFCMVLVGFLTSVQYSVAAADITPKKASTATPATEEASSILSEIPGILSSSDEKLYRQIFAHQQKGEWAKAERLIRKLDNKILMGHIRYQKLMHPRKYRSSYGELAAWMARYADHPFARQVYTLAKKRQGRASPPRKPVATNYPGVTGQSARTSPPTPFRKREVQKRVSNFKRLIRRYVSKGNPQRAEQRYWAMERAGLLTAHERAWALSRIASSYYYEGYDEKARVIAMHGSELSSATVPQNDWIAGLAHYRQDMKKGAFDYFEKLSNSATASSWLESAGQFWASRTAYQLRDTVNGEKYLRWAAGHGETFYGLIAGHQLGLKPKLEWALPTLTKQEMADLDGYPAVRRAIALVEVGRDDLADEELRLLWGREGIQVQKQLMALTAHLNLPALQVRLGLAGGLPEKSPAILRYPIPDWAPADGLRIDRALIFAMMRKESVFKSRARSHAGARGLMQVMPATARILSRDNETLRRNRYKLTEPEYNMALGQQYVEYLETMDYTQANLLMLLAAYNGGPGNLIRWQKEINYKQDPLLFIESISFYETRDYIERVMANLWLYRNRLGQDTPTLEAIAEGAWPVFIPQDTPQSIKDKQRRLARR